MIAQANALAAWLLDGYAAATVLLLAALVAGLLVRQPVRRMAVAWATMLGLALVLVAAAMPGWPRLSPFASAEVQSTVDAAGAHDAVRVPTAVLLPSPIRRAEITSNRSLSNDRAPESVGSDVESVASPALMSKRYRDSIGDHAVVLWAIGVLAVVLWLSAGAISALRFCRQASPAPAEIQAELTKLVGSVGRSPRLLVSPAVPTAAACGVFRPVILLPQAALADSARSALPMLLAHEWAHIARGDLWLLMLGRILFVVLYAHPLFWLLRRRVAMDQELVADAYAASLCGRQQYAEQLFEWARRLDRRAPRLTWGMGMDDRPGQLSRRIAMLLDEQIRLETRCGKRWQLATTICGAAAVALLSVITLQSERQVRAEPAAAVPNAVEASATVAATELVSPADKAAAAANVDDDNQPADPADVERIVKRLEIFSAVKVDAPQVAKMTRGDLARWQRLCDRMLAEGQVKVAGNCRDEAGEPIAGARWRLFMLDYREKRQTQVQEIVTDSAGQFQFNPVQGTFLKRQPVQHIAWDGAPTLYLVGQASGRATIFWHIYAGESNEKLDLVMPAAASLEGQVVDAEGRPVAGAKVMASQEGLLEPILGVRSATTDNLGRYVIADLAPWRAGDAKRPPDDEGRPVQRTFDYGRVDHPDFAPKSFQYTGGVPETFDVTLARPAIVTGRIIIADTGEPAVDATVELRSDLWNETTTTGSDGRFIVKRAVPAKLQLTAKLLGRPTILRSGIEVHSGENEINLRFVNGGTIRGRVSELATGRPPIHQPLEQFAIAIACNAQGAVLETAAIEADGTFTMLLPDGPALLSIFEVGGASVPGDRFILDDGHRVSAKRMEVVSGQAADVDLRLLTLSEYGDPETPQPSVSIAAEATPLAEQAAAAAISKLGGWTKAEKIDGVERVVEVNMIYFDKEDGTRLENKFYTDESLDYVRKFPQLKMLALTRGQANDKALANLRGLEHLTMFFIFEAWNITDAAVDHLLNLPALVSVELLDAQQLTDAAVQKLSRIKRLENFGVTGGSLSDASLQYVARLGNLQSLQLGSSVATFTDDGLKNLAGLEQLEYLAIEGRGITDAGLEHLRGLKKLKHLMVAGTAVTEAGAARLREVLPDLEVNGCRTVDAPAVDRD